MASEDYPAATPADAFEHARAMLGGRLLLASDFDGTLSRPTLDPWRSTIIPMAQHALRRLAAAADVHVALISGRTVVDLAARAPIAGASYHGDHGAEWAFAAARFGGSALRVEREPVPAEVLEMAARLKTEVPGRVDEPWLVLEDKGPALTFHFRAAPDIEAARARVTAAVDAVGPDRVLQRMEGRRTLELRPIGAATKGTTLDRLMRRHDPATVLMLGDDHHDSRAFDVLRSARDGGRIEGLAVAVVGPAADAREVAAHADLVLPSPDAVAVFLGLLAGVRGAIASSSAPDG